jgi:hypothetical protein
MLIKMTEQTFFELILPLPVDHFRSDLVLSLRLFDVDDRTLPAPIEGDVRRSFGLAGQDSGLALVRR